MSASLSGKLLRESRGDPGVLAQLVAEAVARRWLASLGIPAWRNPATPGEEGRYSLILGDGRRIAVCPLGGRGVSYDGMAAAKCSLLIVVDLDADGGGGNPTGCAGLGDLAGRADPEREVEPAKAGLRPAAAIASVLARPARPGLAGFLGTLRLLLAGEPEPPPPEQRSRFTVHGSPQDGHGTVNREQ